MELSELTPALYVFCISFCGVLGLLFGSFMNSCIYKIPMEHTLFTKTSLCPACQTPIKFMHNLPVIGYILQHGISDCCKAQIPIRQPLIEIFTCLLFILVFLQFGFKYLTLYYWIFIVWLLLIIYLELEHNTSPKTSLLIGVLVGFIGAFGINTLSWTEAATAAAIGFSITVLWTGLISFVTNTALDFTTAKILMLIGAFLGLEGVLFTIFSGIIISGILGIIIIVSQDLEESHITFKPIFALSAVLYLFSGPQLIQWYVQFLS
jgi:leader peptidase (prepilin peptidase)/N-methyltransferase